LKIILLIIMICATFVYADIKNGIYVYKTHCANCHSVKMEGGMGRDFNLVSYDRRKEQIVSYIQNPSMNFREFGYSANAMPKIALDEEDIYDVAEYIDSLQKFKKWMKKQ